MRRTELPRPRLAREGLVPASLEKRVDKRNMLIPKTGHVDDHLPTVRVFSDMPREKRILDEICETADLIRENGHS